MKYNVVIIKNDTEEVTWKSEALNERMGFRVKSGAEINLNHKEYRVELKEA